MVRLSGIGIGLEICQYSVLSDGATEPAHLRNGRLIGRGRMTAILLGDNRSNVAGRVQQAVEVSEQSEQALARLGILESESPALSRTGDRRGETTDAS